MSIDLFARFLLMIYDCGKETLDVLIGTVVMAAKSVKPIGEAGAKCWRIVVFERGVV